MGMFRRKSFFAYRGQTVEWEEITTGTSQSAQRPTNHAFPKIVFLQRYLQSESEYKTHKQTFSHDTHAHTPTTSKRSGSAHTIQTVTHEIRTKRVKSNLIQKKKKKKKKKLNQKKKKKKKKS